MENWGLVTFQETSLLFDVNSSSISDKRWVAATVSHEISHQWFGDLVTMKVYFHSKYYTWYLMCLYDILSIHFFGILFLHSLILNLVVGWSLAERGLCLLRRISRRWIRYFLFKFHGRNILFCSISFLFVFISFVVEPKWNFSQIFPASDLQDALNLDAMSNSHPIRAQVLISLLHISIFKN